ncbi:diacylglycerol kinase family lipid kinase [soil metagenome]
MITIIFNPASGSASNVEILRAQFPEGADIVYRPTEQPADSLRFAIEAARGGSDTIIAAGGDGTISDVLNGIMEGGAADVRLGIFPLGTGNDLARSVYTTDDKSRIAQLLKDGVERRVDVVRMTSTDTTRFFLNASGGGFSAELSRDIHASAIKHWLGSLSYAVTGAVALPKATSHSAEIVFDGDEKISVDLVNIVISNGRFIGGGIAIAPTALLDDGLLNVLLTPDLPVAAIIANAKLLMEGQVMQSVDMVLRTARRIEIRAKPPMLFNADGEIIGAGDFTFEVMPRALRLIADPGA